MERGGGGGRGSSIYNNILVECSAKQSNWMWAGIYCLTLLSVRGVCIRALSHPMPVPNNNVFCIMYECLCDEISTRSCIYFVLLDVPYMYVQKQVSRHSPYNYKSYMVRTYIRYYQMYWLHCFVLCVCCCLPAKVYNHLACQYYCVSSLAIPLLGKLCYSFAGGRQPSGACDLAAQQIARAASIAATGNLCVCVNYERRNERRPYRHLAAGTATTTQTVDTHFCEVFMCSKSGVVAREGAGGVRRHWRYEKEVPEWMNEWVGAVR